MRRNGSVHLAPIDQLLDQGTNATCTNSPTLADIKPSSLRIMTHRRSTENSASLYLKSDLPSCEKGTTKRIERKSYILSNDKLKHVHYIQVNMAKQHCQVECSLTHVHYAFINIYVGKNIFCMCPTSEPAF